MALEQVDTSAVKELRRDLEARPRMHGYYLFRVIRAAGSWPSDEDRLDAIFEALDDRPWPSREERERFASGQTWADYAVDEPQTARVAIEALVGGRWIGHTVDTLAPVDAEALWARFRALFAADARFFTRLGLGDHQNVFSNGVAVVDPNLAGVLVVVESD